MVGHQPAKTQADQFTLRSIFWSTTALALLLAYARHLGAEVVVQAVVYGLSAVVAGLCIGAICGNWKDALFWSSLVTLMAFIAVAGGRLPNAAVGFGWGAVGAICGGVCGVRFPKSLWIGSLLSAFLGFVSMSLVVNSLGESLTGLVLFDVLCAAAVGGLLRPFIQFLQWFEQQSHQPRILLVSWLTVCVLTGNWLVPIVAGVTR